MAGAQRRGAIGAAYGRVVFDADQASDAAAQLRRRVRGAALRSHLGCPRLVHAWHAAVRCCMRCVARDGGVLRHSLPHAAMYVRSLPGCDVVLYAVRCAMSCATVAPEAAVDWSLTEQQPQCSWNISSLHRKRSAAAVDVNVACSRRHACAGRRGRMSLMTEVSRSSRTCSSPR